MESNSTATGELFSDPCVTKARDSFRQKSRALTNKLTTIAKAIDFHVNDGDYLAIGGFGADRVPVAAVHEILRQRKKGLGFAGHTATHDFQVICAGNLDETNPLLSRIDIAYVVGLEARGLSPQARRVMESGKVAICEWTNFTLALRFKAAAMGVPFLPARSMLGTETFARSAAKVINCPFTGQTLVAVPALFPDVSIIHVHEADCFGNCRIRGTSVADIDLARASKRLIITCERVIANEEIRRDPTQTVIPFFCVDAVCEIPFGSFPGNMPYEYYSDEDHLRQWLTVEKDLHSYQEFLDRHIYGVKDFSEYLQLCGGLPRLQQLRHQELLLPPVKE